MAGEELLFQAGSGALIGFITGWGLKKLLRIVIKVAAIILALFFLALAWLETQKIIIVSWHTLESQASTSLEWIGNTALNGDPTNHPLNQVLSNLGITFAAPLGVAFVAGFIRG